MVHGTDTLSYTSSALSFSLFSIKIPIILTASQYPLAYGINSDAPQNLLGSIFTIYELIQRNFLGVYVYFHGKLLRPNRIRKVHSNNVDAFHSVNSTSIGTFENFKVTLYESYFQYIERVILDTNKKWKDLLTSFKFSKNVKLIRINPSLEIEDFDTVLSKKEKYIIILTAYGTGNGPKWLIEFTKNTKSNLTFFACSECYNGKTQEHYEVDLNHENCKTLIDMTPESALTKASFLLMNKKLENKSWNDTIIYKSKEMTIRKWLQRKMKECFRGEITNENSKFPNDLFFLGNN